MQEKISTIIEILKEYNEVMNSTLGDEVKVTSCNGTTVRKATLQDNIDLYKSEWSNVIERLSDEAGIDLESKEWYLWNY